MTNACKCGAKFILRLGELLKTELIVFFKRQTPAWKARALRKKARRMELPLDCPYGSYNQFWEYDERQNAIHGYFDPASLDRFASRFQIQYERRHIDHDVLTYPEFWEKGLNPQLKTLKLVHLYHFDKLPMDEAENPKPELTFQISTDTDPGLEIFSNMSGAVVMYQYLEKLLTDKTTRIPSPEKGNRDFVSRSPSEGYKLVDEVQFHLWEPERFEALKRQHEAQSPECS